MKRLVFLLLICLSSSCLDPISFDDVEGTNKLVVDAVLNLTERTQEVKLSRSLPFGQKIDLFESDAIVSLIHNESTLTYEEVEPGIYQLDVEPDFLLSGESYSLHIMTSSGDEYLSTPEIMPVLYPASDAVSIFEREIITLSTGIEVTGNVLNTYLSTDIPAENEEPAYFRWFYDELYLFTKESCGPLDPSFTCYISQDGNNQNFNLLSSEDIAGATVENIKVASKFNFPIREFVNRHYFIVYQQSITEAAHEYWLKVKEITSQSGTVFDLPPAPIQGNVLNLNDPEKHALGYFELSAVDTIRPFIFPSEFEEVITREKICSPFNRRNWPDECCNCFVLEGASLDRPSWVN